MATAASQEHEHRAADNGTTAPSPSATNSWGPYSGAGDFASNMAIILAALLTALALAVALTATVRYLLRRCRRRGRAGAAQGDPEKPLSAEVTSPPPSLVYSAAGTKLAGAAECAICLAEFVDGDAVRVMPACGHGFHARCIERWLAGGLRSSCPTYRRGCRDRRVLMPSYMRALIVFCFPLSAIRSYLPLSMCSYFNGIGISNWIVDDFK